MSRDMAPRARTHLGTSQISRIGERGFYAQPLQRGAHGVVVWRIVDTSLSPLGDMLPWVSAADTPQHSWDRHHMRRFHANMVEPP